MDVQLEQLYNENMTKDEFDANKGWIKVLIDNRLFELKQWEDLIRQRENQVRKHEIFLEEKMKLLEKN